MKKLFIFAIAVFLFGIGAYFLLFRPDKISLPNINNNELEKSDLIRADFPRPNQTIQSPLIVKGEARGFWFFEASFPIKLLDDNGEFIAQGIAIPIHVADDPQTCTVRGLGVIIDDEHLLQDIMIPSSQ